jgi:hypothetical protein
LGSQANDSQAQLLAMMQAMQDELRNLRQGAPTTGPVPATSAPPPTGGGVPTTPHGALVLPIPISGISLMKWMGMKLDTSDGNGTYVHVADWLTYVEDKMEVFEVVYQDRVRFSTRHF